MADSALYWSDTLQNLFADPALSFDPWAMQWQPFEQPAPTDLQAVAAPQALLNLGARLRQVPVAVIGPREASDEEYATAEAMGAALAGHHLQLLCGGKNGVMEASAKGHLEAGGRPIGLVPEGDWRCANPYVRIPIATGIGKSRNVIIAQSSTVLIAVGGGYGTMSEMAFGLHFDKLVLALGDAPALPGVVACTSVDEALNRTAEHLLQLPEPVDDEADAGAGLS
ncbi:MAG: LOG family protein [Alcaligenaceae bacterium]|nr:LOG family protein [Alcaligenaceae bacterium]